MKSVAAAVVLTILLACVWGWTRALGRWRAGACILPLEPRRPVPWGLLDVVFTVFVFLTALVVTMSIVRHVFGVDLSVDPAGMTPGARAVGVLLDAVCRVLTVIISSGVIMLRTKASWDDLGIAVRRIASDIRLGVAAFVMLAPPVYGVQVLLAQWLKPHHPLIELLTENPDAVFLSLIGFSAVIVAPIAEEYFFRVLVQGWLEKVITISRRLSIAPFSQGVDTPPREVGNRVEPVETPRHPSKAACAVGKGNVTTIDDPAGPSDGRVLPVPIVITAAIFAVAHASHGPAPIPLFLFAIGLGYLYQRTHRILPCIIVHFLLNACSLGALTLEIYGS